MDGHRLSTDLCREYLSFLACLNAFVVMLRLIDDDVKKYFCNPAYSPANCSFAMYFRRGGQVGGSTLVVFPVVGARLVVLATVSPLAYFPSISDTGEGCEGGTIFSLGVVL